MDFLFGFLEEKLQLFHNYSHYRLQDDYYLAVFMKANRKYFISTLAA